MWFLDPPLLIICISASAYLGMLWAFRRKEKLRQPAIQVLLAALLVSLAWTVVLGLQRAQEIRLVTGFDAYALGRIAVYLLLILAALFLQLTRMFHRRVGVRDASQHSLAWWSACGGFLLFGALLYENPLRLRDALFSIGGQNTMRWDAGFLILAAGWGLFIGSAVLLTKRDYRRTVSPLHRNRGKYWSLVLILAVAGGGLALAQRALPASLLHLLAMIVITVLLVTYNLPDMRLALRGTARYALTTLITVAVYAGGFLAAQFALRGTNGSQMVIAAVGLAAVLAVFFNPLLKVVDGLVRQLVSGAHYDSRQTLSEYSLSISNILDMELLAAIAVGLISEAMEITHGALVTVTRETVINPFEERDPAPQPLAAGTENAAVETAVVDQAAELDAADGDNAVMVLRLTSGTGEALPEGRLSGKNPAVAYLRRDHRPLTQYDIDLQPRFDEMQPEERAWLSGLQMDIFIPIYAKGTWIGLLALGPKVSGDRYFTEDLDLLQTLADQTAVALENARLYENLKQRNAENERLNSQLQAANEELASLDQAKTDFINIASHELRTPLTQVMGYNDILTEMIKSGPVETPTALQMTESVRKAARRLEEIVETMFDVTKIDTNTLDLQRAPVTFNTIITVAVENWQKGMIERNISVLIRGIIELPTIVVDGKRLTQVFTQLVQNAIKSMPDGGQIGITGRVIEAGDTPNLPEACCIEIIVSDTGIGIAAEELERIFNKFYRVGNVLLHSTGDTKFKGAGPGLGLSIARGIVEAHGGRIWAESQGYDEQTCPGAKFHVLLPVEPLKK